MKEVSYSKSVLSSDKVSTQVQHCSKEIEVRQGFSSLTTLVYQGQGNESSGFPNSDLIFKFVEKPHASFTRQEKDLTYTCRLDLIDALLANPIAIQTFDGRVLTLSFNEIVTPQTKKVIENEGMPFLKGNEYATDLLQHGRSRKAPERGDLVVVFDIIFPQYISDTHKRTLKDILVKP